MGRIQALPLDPLIKDLPTPLLDEHRQPYTILFITQTESPTLVFFAKKMK